MYKYVILVVFCNVIHCDDLENIDAFFAKGFKFGDPTNSFADSLIHSEVSCAAPPPTDFIQEATITFNKTFQGNPTPLEVGKDMFKPFAIQGELPICKMIAKFKMDKAKVLAEHLDAKANETKVFRDRFISGLTEAAQPHSKGSVPLLICYIKEWIQKTLEVYSEANGLKEFVKDYTDLMIFPYIALLENKFGKGKPTCKLPEPYPVPSKYKSAQIPFLLAVHNLCGSKEKLLSRSNK